MIQMQLKADNTNLVMFFIFLTKYYFTFIYFHALECSLYQANSQILL